MNQETIIRSRNKHLIFALPSAFLTLVICGCESSADRERAEWAQLQRNSLSSVFFRGNPLPGQPTAEEIGRTLDKVRSANHWERDLLEELYPDDHELWVYAIRDSDGDGVLDYRVSDYYGKFLEGDTDIDGDGIDNVLDTTPFIASPGEREIANIPPPLDWSRQGKPQDITRIQRELFENHRILLVERSAEFTPDLARSVHDVVTRMYRGIFADNGTLPTLRIVATEESSLLDPEDEAGASDFAQVLPASQTLEIYRRGIDAPPVIQLGYLAHEIAHNIQFSYDYDAQRQDEIMRHNYFAATRFLELVEPFGWTTIQTESAPESRFTLFRPQYVAQEPYEYLYLDEPLGEWEEWLAAIFEEVGEDRYLTDERITELHIVGDYSLSGPWEWYSDNIIAYLYLEMLDSQAGQCPEAERKALAEAFQRETVAREWPWFRFENARGATILAHLREEYPLDAADLAYLADHYLLSRHPGFCRNR